MNKFVAACRLIWEILSCLLGGGVRQVRPSQHSLCPLASSKLKVKGLSTMVVNQDVLTVTEFCPVEYT